MIVAVGIIVALLLLAWAGVEVHMLIVTYPGECLMGLFGLVFIMVGLAARHRAANRPVRLTPLKPPAPPPALQAKPVLTAIATTAAEDAAECDNPRCSNKVDDDPWVGRLNGETDVEARQFCSEACVQEWADTLN